ncbi:hypothetical protein BDN70DRAFT_899525 [Pholiota conissans]|uniref:Uncharacterized protein n=1 Tax=Pholiota conissans TaxID=109636 RepID=A0A9P5YRF0_9AGAR|nr:hypothetical protein BDN70DRAFT_899525 [Pholiota conissans]
MKLKSRKHPVAQCNNALNTAVKTPDGQSSPSLKKVKLSLLAKKIKQKLRDAMRKTPSSLLSRPQCIAATESAWRLFIHFGPGGSCDSQIDSQTLWISPGHLPLPNLFAVLNASASNESQSKANSDNEGSEAEGGYDGDMTLVESFANDNGIGTY